MDYMVQALEAETIRRMKVDGLGFMLRLAAGRITQDPFSKEVVEKARAKLLTFFGVPEDRCNFL